MGGRLKPRILEAADAADHDLKVRLTQTLVLLCKTNKSLNQSSALASMEPVLQYDVQSHIVEESVLDNLDEARDLGVSGLLPFRHEYFQGLVQAIARRHFLHVRLLGIVPQNKAACSTS